VIAFIEIHTYMACTFPRGLYRSIQVQVCADPLTKRSLSHKFLRFIGFFYLVSYDQCDQHLESYRLVASVSIETLFFAHVCRALNKEYQEGACGENALLSVRRMWRYKSNPNTTIDSIDTYESNLLCMKI